MSLESLSGRNLLFSEARQAIYELDDLSAYVWRSLDSGNTPDQIVREVTAAGVAAEDARLAVLSSVDRLGPLRSAKEHLTGLPGPEPVGRLTSRTLEIAGVVVQLHLSSALLDGVDDVLGHLRSESPETDVQICARVAGDRVRFYLPGQPEWSCERAEFVPVLKARLIDEIIRTAPCEIALHAAAFVRHERVLLLVGSPGAGKTTLGLALARGGFALAADDVVLLDEHGLVTGLAFAPAAKESSWRLVGRVWPDLWNCPSHQRPDGKKVRYLLPPVWAAPVAWPIGAVALLDRRGEAQTAVHDIDPADALAALIAEGSARDQRLSALGFRALVSALTGAHCCRLTYCDLVEATERLRDLCSHD